MPQQGAGMEPEGTQAGGTPAVPADDRGNAAEQEDGDRPEENHRLTAYRLLPKGPKLVPRGSIAPGWMRPPTVGPIAVCR